MFHKPNNKPQVHYHGDGLKNLLIGMGLGAALAWVFTTKEGEALRQRLFEEEGDIAEKLKELIAEMKGETGTKESIESAQSPQALTPTPAPQREPALSVVAQLYGEEPVAIPQAPVGRTQPFVIREMEAAPRVSEPILDDIRKVTVVTTSRIPEPIPEEIPQIYIPQPEPESEASTAEADAALRSMRQRRFFRRVR